MVDGVLAIDKRAISDLIKLPAPSREICFYAKKFCQMYLLITKDLKMNSVSAFFLSLKFFKMLAVNY